MRLPCRVCHQQLLFAASGLALSVPPERLDRAAEKGGQMAARFGFWIYQNFLFPDESYRLLRAYCVLCVGLGACSFVQLLFIIHNLYCNLGKYLCV